MMMRDGQKTRELRPSREIVIVAARWVLGGVFLMFGLSKALHPVEFLKLVREYGVFESAVTLNLVAALLPWVEIVCGLLLLVGVAVRGTALLLGALLVGFTVAIMVRALGIHGASGVAFCAIKFDCGCGGGEVLACRKIVENGALAVLCVIQVISGRGRWCVRHALRSQRSDG